MTEAHKLHRKYASDTSVEAAYALNSTRLEATVYQCIHSFGATGCISDEVRTALPGLTYSSVTARYSALLDLGAIVVIGKRPGISGRNQRIMIACVFQPALPQQPKATGGIMDIVTIDFETYYAPDYTLSKMTTEEYIRDDRFEVIGVSVKVNDHPADWYTGDNVGAFLNSLDYTDKAICCHHTAFDGAILAWHFGIKPKFWFDTLSMARPNYSVMVGGSLKNLAVKFKLGEKGTAVVDAYGKRRKDFTPAEMSRYGEYCIQDNNLTRGLFLKLQRGFPVSELMVIDQTIRMFTEPVIELDRRKLNDHLESERARKLALLNKLGNGDPETAKKILMSNQKFAQLLGAFFVNPPMKISPTTGKETYAFAKTDLGMLALLNHPNPSVAAIAEVRLGTKSTIEETRTTRLIQVSERGPLPILLNYYGAHTGRFSGGDKLNLQNLPARKGNAIRQALRAPDGHKLIACDSSQIEARVLAWLAGQDDLVQAFREGRDVYSEFASMVYGYEVTKANYKERFVGKTSILGLGYGMGAEKFRDTLRVQGDIDIDIDEAQRIVYLYRNMYSKIKAYWRTCDNVLINMTTGQTGVISNLISYTPAGITLPNEMNLGYTALRSTSEGFFYIRDNRGFRKLTARVVSGCEKEDVPWTNIYGGKVVENITQALARIVVADQMVAISKYYRVILQVHDENIICVPTELANAAKLVMEREMSTPPAWALDLPIACEVASGDTYGDCK